MIEFLASVTIAIILLLMYGSKIKKTWKKTEIIEVASVCHVAPSYYDGEPGHCSVLFSDGTTAKFDKKSWFVAHNLSKGDKIIRVTILGVKSYSPAPSDPPNETD